MKKTELAVLFALFCGCACVAPDPLDVPAAVDAEDPVPKTVTRRIELLKDGDLSRYWYTWLKKVQRRNADPEHVFVADGSTLRISGTDMGCVTTRDAYRDYRLTLEFRYVDNDRQLNKTAARDSGILFHSTGKDGVFGKGIWMCSFEYNIIQGATGDLLLVARRSGDEGDAVPALGPERHRDLARRSRAHPPSGRRPGMEEPEDAAAFAERKADWRVESRGGRLSRRPRDVLLQRDESGRVSRPHAVRRTHTAAERGLWRRVPQHHTRSAVRDFRFSHFDPACLQNFWYNTIQCWQK